MDANERNPYATIDRLSRRPTSSKLSVVVMWMAWPLFSGLCFVGASFGQSDLSWTLVAAIIGGFLGLFLGAALLPIDLRFLDGRPVRLVVHRVLTPTSVIALGTSFVVSLLLSPVEGVLVGIPLTALLYTGIAVRFGRKEPVRWGIGMCRECGYSLEGLTTDVCPECGQEFRVQTVE